MYKYLHSVPLTIGHVASLALIWIATRHPVIISVVRTCLQFPHTYVHYTHTDSFGLHYTSCVYHIKKILCLLLRSLPLFQKLQLINDLIFKLTILPRLTTVQFTIHITPTMNQRNSQTPVKSLQQSLYNEFDWFI